MDIYNYIKVIIIINKSNGDVRNKIIVIIVIVIKPREREEKRNRQHLIFHSTKIKRKRRRSTSRLRRGLILTRLHFALCVCVAVFQIPSTLALYMRFTATKSYAVLSVYICSYFYNHYDFLDKHFFIISMLSQNLFLVRIYMHMQRQNLGCKR